MRTYRRAKQRTAWKWALVLALISAGFWGTSRVEAFERIRVKSATLAPKDTSFWKWALVLALISAGFWGTSRVEAVEPIRVKLATLAPKDTSLHQALQEMGEKWRRATGGAVVLTIYTGTMGREADMVRKMRIGKIQSAMLTVVGLSEIDPSVTALQKMPMMFRSLDEVDYVREKLTSDLDRRFREKGFVVLFWGDVGWVRFFTKEPVLHPTDLKKMKVFVWAGDNNQVDLMTAAGYQPVSLETNDILSSLQTGLINAIPTVPLIALAGQFYGPCHHMLELNWAPLVGGTVITKDAWNSIPRSDQEALRKAAAEAGNQIKTKSRAESDQSVAAMKKRGLVVHPVPPEIEVEWRKAAEEVYPKIRGKMVPADMFDQVQSLLKEYRKSGRKS